MHALQDLYTLGLNTYIYCRYIYKHMVLRCLSSAQKVNLHLSSSQSSFRSGLIPATHWFPSPLIVQPWNIPTYLKLQLSFKVISPRKSSDIQNLSSYCKDFPPFFAKSAVSPLCSKCNFTTTCSFLHQRGSVVSCCDSCWLQPQQVSVSSSKLLFKQK